MANFFKDNDDLAFYFDKGIDWAPLVEVTEYGFRTHDGFKNEKDAVGFYKEVAEMVGELVADQIAPNAAQIDRDANHVKDGDVEEGAAMRAVFSSLKSAELHKMCIPRELGGMNAPLLVYFACAEMLARADVSVMTHFSFHGGMAMAMLVYSIHEGTTEFDVEGAKIKSTRFAAEMEEIARGDAWGCMDITEPNAGSDMAALRTKAEQDENGEWFVTGQKIFITSGHGKYHFVIARTEEAADPDDAFAGLGGLSMFLVARGPQVTIDRVEEKLGHHGSVTAALSFERAPARLIGKRGEGFKYMLTLMNNARLGVGFESLGLAECATRMAREYAEGRRSMGKSIDRHEMIADYLDEMGTDVQAIRALAMTGAYAEEMSQKLELMKKFLPHASPAERERVERELPKFKARARRLTPLLKYFAAEKSVEIARRGVQIHGGVGYTKDYGAEKLLRDAMVLPIYEGTSQIQSLMAMKDTLLGIIKRPQQFVTRLGQARWRSVSARDPLERRVAKIQTLSLSAQQHLMTKTALAKIGGLADKPVSSWRDAMTKEWDPKRDFALAMLHAERLTKLLVDEAVAEIFLKQSRKHPERREVLERWLDRVEIRDKAIHEEITTTGEKLLASLQNTTTAAAAE